MAPSPPVPTQVSQSCSARLATGRLQLLKVTKGFLLPLLKPWVPQGMEKAFHPWVTAHTRRQAKTTKAALNSPRCLAGVTSPDT